MLHGDDERDGKADDSPGNSTFIVEFTRVEATFFGYFFILQDTNSRSPISRRPDSSDSKERIYEVEAVFFIDKISKEASYSDNEI